MGEEFKKLKKKFLTEAIVKSAICGVAAGLFAAGVVLLALKLSGVTINAGFYALIGAGLAICVGAVMFFIIRPTDVKVAKKLDGEYRLNEKVQTMVEYGGRDGEMIELQRSDTLSRLSALPAKKLTLAKLWQYIVISVVSVALFFTGIFVPLKGEPVIQPEPPVVVDPPVDEDAWEYSMTLQSLMADLIVNIEDSHITEPAKTGVLSTVRGLDTELRTVTKRSVMTETVVSAVMTIDYLIENANSYVDVCTALLEVLGETVESDGDETEDENPDVSDDTEEEEPEKTELISSAILAGIGVIVPYIDTIQTSEFSLIEGLEYNLANEIKSSIDASGFIEAVKAKWDVRESEGLGDLLSEYKDKLTEALEISEVDEDDALYVAVYEFKEGLATIIDMIGKNFGDARLQNEITSAYETLQGKLVTALKPQGYNCMMDVFIRFGLANIFDISSDKLPALSLGLTGGASGSNGNGGNNGGAYGSGEEIFGSDDLIFNPVTGEYVSYGELLADYEKKKAEQSDGLPDDINEYLREYFDILYGGIKEEN